MNENENGAVLENTEPEEKKTYTQEEVDALLQKEADRRVSQALQKQEKKNAEKTRKNERIGKVSI